MAKFDIKALNYITSGPKQNTFNIEYRYTDDGMIQSRPPHVLSTLKQSHVDTFFGDVGVSETMSQSRATNKMSFYDVGNDMIIHGMYRLSKTRLRSTAKARSNASELVDIYLPVISNDFIGICQLQNYAYGLTRDTTRSPVHREMIFNSSTKVDMSYHYQLSSETIDTYMYPTTSDLTNDMAVSTYQLYVTENAQLSNARISSVFSPARNLNDVMYSYLVEIPLGTVENQYDKGHVQCDMAVTKSPHDMLYSIEVSSQEYGIDNSRQYCNIGACGDIAYLTYRTNVNYRNKHKYVTYYDNLDTEYDQLSNDVIQYNESRQQAKDTYTYQHVEVIESIHRFDGSNQNAGHKSSMFSVRIADAGLNEASIEENTKQMLRQSISNNIRKIAEKLCPANTQLFNVYFEGK